MKLSELKAILRGAPDKLLTFSLPDGDVIPAHFHITEVGHVAKKFIDCGGTMRSSAACMLQVWLGSDSDHRLTARKAASILDLAEQITPSDDLDVEVEYEDCSISQYPVEAAEVAGDQIVVRLVSKHTDCLAKEACSVAKADDSASSCCGAGGCS